LRHGGKSFDSKPSAALARLRIFDGMAAGQWIETFSSAAHRRSFVLTLAGYPAQRMRVFGDGCGGCGWCCY